MNISHTDTDRRGAIGASLGWLAGVFALSKASSGMSKPPLVDAAADTGRAPGEAKASWGMVIDLDLCTGCGGCVVACRSENNVPVTGHTTADRGTDIYWMDLLPKSPEQVESATPELLPMPCMQCEDPPCVKVCPVNATYQNEEGLIAQIYDRCIGCRYCMVACPYSRRFFNWKEPVFPEEHKSYLNPDVSTRCEGVVELCTFCSHRIRKVREEARVAERTITDADVQRLPACAESCPADAIAFGNLHDPESLVSRLSVNPRSSRLLDHLGTKPKVFYLSRERRTDDE